MRAYERFLRYAVIDTKSDERSGTHPSTACQWNLAKVLEHELKELGMADVRLSDYGYVMARIPATAGCEHAPVIGFVAHMDTSPDFSDTNVRPQIHENYNGEAVVLGDSGRILSPEAFPHLATLKGRTLITTDGTTLLGGDNKAGIAEIMTLCETLLTGDMPHGEIAVCFTPDEEIGEGTEYFDLAAFGADFAYTVDGGAEGSLEYENFNGAAAHVEVRGFNVHPGSAKGLMINAALVAMEFNALLPGGDIPARTEGYEGFFHLTEMKGDTESASLDYIIRDHDAQQFDARHQTMEHAAKVLNERYGEGTVTLTIREQYRNMLEKIRPHMHLIEAAKEAAARCQADCVIEPIRGGTDGAMLSYKGLPCPNLGTGIHACHGPYEHVTVEGMDIQTAILIEIVAIYAQKTREALG